jgi:exonuclease III
VVRWTPGQGRLAMVMGSERLLIWNVRGLNARVHCYVMRELVAAVQPSLLCLEETKLYVIIDYDLMQIIDTGFNYVYLSTDHTRGGIMVAWKGVVWSVSSQYLRRFSWSARVCHASGGWSGG